MKAEFQRLIDPSEETLNRLGEEGFHFAGCGTTYEMHNCAREARFVVILQREVPDMPKESPAPIDAETAMYRGVRDGFLTWVSELSTATVQKIFGPQS